VIAPHVQQRHLADHRIEQLGPLQHHRAHQQAAVAAALDAEVAGLVILLAIRSSATAMKSS
jgi:hypothetical protein